MFIAAIESPCQFGEAIMSLVTYDPLSLINRMQSEMNDFFRSNGNSVLPSMLEPSADWMPAVDIKETDKQYLVTVDVPGVDPKDIEITLEDGALVVKGERKSEHEESTEGYKLKECSWGSFERRFGLPNAVNDKDVKAKNKNGVLTVTVAKKKSEKKKRIPIAS
jgi:HSP20 family protein